MRVGVLEEFGVFVDVDNAAIQITSSEEEFDSVAPSAAMTPSGAPSLIELDAAVVCGVGTDVGIGGVGVALIFRREHVPVSHSHEES